MAKDTMVLMERGTGKKVAAQDIDIPDIWHLAMALKDSATGRNRIMSLNSLAMIELSDAVLKCWYAAHAMKQHIVES